MDEDDYLYHLEALSVTDTHSVTRSYRRLSNGRYVCRISDRTSTQSRNVSSRDDMIEFFGTSDAAHAFYVSAGLE